MNDPERRLRRKRAFQLLAIEDPAKQLTHAAIARQVGVRRETVSRWASLPGWERSRVKVRGGGSRASSETLESLRSILVRKRWKWSLEKIVDYLQQHTGKSFSRSQACRLRQQLKRSLRRHPAGAYISADRIPRRQRRWYGGQRGNVKP